MTELERQEDITFTDILLLRGQAQARRVIAGLILALALVLNLYHLYAGYFGPPDAHTFRSIHLSLLLVLTFLIRPIAKGGNGRLRKLDTAVNCVLITLVIACQAYQSYDIIALSNRIRNLNQYDVIMGTIMILLVVEATRRVIGWPIWWPFALSFSCILLTPISFSAFSSDHPHLGKHN